MAKSGVNSLRIVLVGKTGSGKSATANTILGEKKFKSQIAAQAVTKHCQSASRNWKGRELLVVDTPGLFDTKESLETTCNEISRCVISSCPGPHAIILVLQLGRFTEEEQKTVDLVKAVFGEAAMKYMVVLFTRKDLLEDQTLNDFLKQDNKLKHVIKECGNRRMAISNKADQAEMEVQMQELVELIDTMVQKNGGTYFSDDVYKDTEERLKRETEVLREIYKSELEKQNRIIEEEYALKLNKLIHTKVNELNAIDKKYEEKLKNVWEEATYSHFTGAGQNVFSRLFQYFQK